VGVYADCGKTARKSLKNRTELARLLSDVEADKIDLIVFTKLDRWFRNIKDYYKTQEILEAHGVNWRTIFENYDTTTANGRLYINIMLSLAQDEADRTSERIKAVFENKRRNGEATCPNVPIGYKLENSKIIIDEERAPIARDLFEHYALHNSMYAAQKYIIDVYGEHLHHYTIKRMLTNPLYIGEYRGYKNFCPPLIDKKQFDEVQDVVKSRNIKNSSPQQYNFIFSGLCVCAECGRRMAGNAQRRTYAGGRKDIYAVYRCNGYYSARNCTHNRAINEKAIEEYLLNNVATELNRYILDFEAAQKKPRKPKIDKAAIAKKLEKLKDLYLNDLIDLDLYRKDYKDLTEKLNAVEPPEEKADLTPLKEFLKSDFLSIYDTLDNEAKRIIWRGVLDRLIITADNNIGIEFTK
jgi:DNA invertase Pin-like site-specific DNA recombinase